MAEQLQGQHRGVAAIPAAQPGVSVAATRPRPSRVAPLLLWGTILLGFAGLACGLATARDLATWRELPPLLALALLAEFATVSFFESGKQRMSLSFTAAVVMAAVAGSFLVSYTRAKAEILGLRGDVGIGSRAERVVVITAALVLAPWGVLPWALALLACTAWITVGQRVLHVRKQLMEAQQ